MLTATQTAILTALAETARAGGKAPTVQDMADQLHISRAQATAGLLVLWRKGFVRREPGRHAIRVVPLRLIGGGR